jgi:FkbM family methyltransferase
MTTFSSSLIGLIIVTGLTDLTKTSNANLHIHNGTHKHRYDSDSAFGAHCNSSQLKTLINVMPSVTLTQCPDRTKWMKVVLEASKTKESATIVVIGCNKGDDFISIMGAWSGNISYDPDKFVSTMRSKYVVSFACPKATKIPFNQTPRLVTGYCIEPMPINFELLTDMANVMNFDSNSVKILPLAISAFPDIAPFPNSKKEGVEFLGLGNGAGGILVNVTNIDSFVRVEKLRMIDFLSIDTEGYDGKVILGMVKTLARGIIRVLEFEFHANPPWSTMVCIHIFCIDIDNTFCCI